MILYHICTVIGVNRSLDAAVYNIKMGQAGAKGCERSRSVPLNSTIKTNKIPTPSVGNSLHFSYKEDNQYLEGIGRTVYGVDPLFFNSSAYSTL